MVALSGSTGWKAETRCRLTSNGWARVYTAKLVEEVDEHIVFEAVPR